MSWSVVASGFPHDPNFRRKLADDFNMARHYCKGNADECKVIDAAEHLAETQVAVFAKDGAVVVSVSANGSYYSGIGNVTVDVKLFYGFVAPEKAAE